MRFAISLIAVLMSACGPTQTEGADAGNSNPGADAGSTSVKRVFITATTYPGTFGSAGNSLQKADWYCQTAATAQNLGGTWKAWLSSGSTNAIDRIAEAGPWYLVDGTTKVFNNKAGLATLPLHTINITEQGSSSMNWAWTGTDVGGTASGADCGGWTGSSSPGLAGNPNHSDSRWTHDLTRFCNDSSGFYCFEQ
jgi:hypothetical protein